MTKNIPTRLNNPGDLKDPTTGAFRYFNDSESGFKALKDDIKGKITGNTRTNLNGNSSLLDFANVWAPASDRNDPKGYAQKLATKLGVSATAPISSLSNRLDDFASAIADNEGYQGNRVLGSTESISPAQSVLNESEFAAKIKAKYPQYQNLDDTTLTQKVLAKYPQYKNVIGQSKGAPNSGGYIDTADIPKPTPDAGKNKTGGNIESGIRGFGNLVTGGGTETLGKSLGTNIGYLAEKAKGLLGGQDNSQYFDQSQPSVGDVAKAGVKTGGAIAGIVGAGGLLGKLLGGIRGGSYLGSNVARGALSNYAKSTGSAVSELSNAEKVNALHEASMTADAATQPILRQAAQEALSQSLKEQGIGSFAEIHPGMAKTLGLTGKAFKWALIGTGLLEGPGIIKSLASRL